MNIKFATALSYLNDQPIDLIDNIGLFVARIKTYSFSNMLFWIVDLVADDAIAHRRASGSKRHHPTFDSLYPLKY
jgi:hypothetical protein